MIPERLINVVKWLAPYVVVALLVLAAVLFYNHQISESRQEGFDAGVSHQKGVQAEADQEEGDRRDAEKERLERQHQAKVESMSADIANADATNDRLRGEIDSLREYLGKVAGAEPNGTSTIQIARVLTELYRESVEQYGKVAEEAERYRIAGEQCELQYDAMRNRHAVESASVDHTAN